MSKLQWYLIILMLIVFSAIGIHQITTTRKLRKTIKEYEQVLEQNQRPQKQAIKPVDFDKQVSEGHDSHTDESHEFLPEDEISEDEQISTERIPHSGEKLGEEPMVEATSPPESEKPIEEASSEYKEFMERHRNFLDIHKQMQVESDEVLESVIPQVVSTLNSMTANEQKEFLKQMKAMAWTHAQDAGNTNSQGFDESIEAFVNMLKEKGFQPRY